MVSMDVINKRSQDRSHMQVCAPISTQQFQFQSPQVSRVHHHPILPHPPASPRTTRTTSAYPATRTTSGRPNTNRVQSSRLDRTHFVAPNFGTQSILSNIPGPSLNMVPTAIKVRGVSTKTAGRNMSSRAGSSSNPPSSNSSASVKSQSKRPATVITTSRTIWLDPKTPVLSRRPATTDASSRRPNNQPSISPTINKIEMISTKQDVNITSVSFTCDSSKTNHTSRLHCESTEVVLRRGNQLVLTINTSFVLDYDCIVGLTFVPVFRPQERFAQFRTEKDAKTMKKGVSLGVPVPTNFPVGKYHAHISLTKKSSKDIMTHFHHQAIVVLFNPWDPLDDAYMEDEAQREAYLVQDVGTIWRGIDSSKIPLLWEYGQYEEHTLDVALYLLRELSVEQCKSAASVCRGLIAQLNSRDQNGLLVESAGGRGPGSHVGGLHPSRWTGSTAILGKYFRTRSPVRFGQCWVFAGVAVSLLRVLGIVSRPVTCYNAAHYCKKLGQVERFFSPSGDVLHSLNRDQLWVYHVWCEAWMRRDDLPEGYNGWQVLDPTSQGRQSGRFRIGPASVRAIKEGLDGKNWPYDNEYVRSEIESDVRYMRSFGQYSFCKTNEQLNLARVNRDEVGTSIVTSSYGDLPEHEPVDITGFYKNTTTTLTLGDSTACMDKGRTFPAPSRDCAFEVGNNGAVKLGEEVVVNMDVCNKGALLRTVDGKVVGSAILYTGEPICNFMSVEFSGIISPGQSASVNVPLEAKKYMRGIAEQCILQFFIAVKARESKQLFLKVHHVQLDMPELKLFCAPSVCVGSMLRVRISFTNTLFNSLSRLLFLLQAQSLCPSRELSYKKLVFPGTTATVECTLYPSQPGSFTLLASLSCDQLTEIRGHTKVTVHPKVTAQPKLTVHPKVIVHPK